MNFVALEAVRRIEPELFAGDRFSEASADASILHTVETDSLELHVDELGPEVGGSSLSEVLKIVNIHNKPASDTYY